MEKMMIIMAIPDDINGWNFIDNNSEVFDKNNPHGTSIAVSSVQTAKDIVKEIKQIFK